MKPTVCYNCKHFYPSDPGSDIWYNHFCIARPLPLVFNYVTGKQESREYAHCRDINTDGKCASFKLGSVVDLSAELAQVRLLPYLPS